MTDNTTRALGFGVSVGFFVLLDKVDRAGKSDLIDVFVDLFGVHADAVIRKGERAEVVVERHVNAVGRTVRLGLAERNKAFVLGYRVARVGYKLAHENVFIRIKPFFDDRKNIFGFDGNAAFFDLVFTHKVRLLSGKNCSLILITL